MEAILPQTDDAPAAAVAEPSTSTMPTDAAASAAAVTPAPASVQLAAVQPARDAPTAAAAPAPASTITIAPAVAVGTPPATPFPTTGVVLFAGAAAHSLAGRAGPTQTYDGVAEQNLMSFHVIASLSSIKVKSVASSGIACHYAAIAEDGGLYMWGRNERGQLGTGDLINVYAPSRATGLPAIASVAIGRAFTIAVAVDGSVWACGECKSGQLGLGRSSDTPQLTWAKSGKGLPEGVTVVAAAAGGDFAVALTAAGAVYACGSYEAGQLGNGVTGERIVTAGKTAFDTQCSWGQVTEGGLATETITSVAAGAAHTLALTSSGAVYSWGSGAYGRLGHNGAKDELKPRRIAAFDPPRWVVAAAGSGGLVL